MSSRSRRQTMLILFAGVVAVVAALFFAMTFNDMDTERIGNSLTTSADPLSTTTEEAAVETPAPSTPRSPSRPSTTQGGGSNSQGTVPTSLGAVVTYTGNGFSPSRVTIAQGETVHFINQSDRKLWVGSDVHPTHEAYPERKLTDCLGSSFDQCRAAGTGESWDFTFNAVGEWDYHNHMRARDIGTIIVTE